MTGGAEITWTKESLDKRMASIREDIAKEEALFQSSKGKVRKGHAKAVRFLKELLRQDEISKDMMGW
jgi:hypothetical protein